MITRAAFCGVKRWSVLVSRMVGKDVIGISFVDLEFSGADQRDAAEGRRPSHREVETTDLVSNAASTVAHAPGSTRCRARRPTQRTTDLPMNSGLECRERNGLECRPVMPAPVRVRPRPKGRVDVWRPPTQTPPRTKAVPPPTPPPQRLGPADGSTVRRAGCAADAV